MPSKNVLELKEKTLPIQKITPFLWFDHQAEEAASFYTSIFPNSKVVKVIRYGEAGPGPAGSAMTVQFQLEQSRSVKIPARHEGDTDDEKARHPRA